MGRHRRRPNDRGHGTVKSDVTSDKIEERLGLHDLVCTACNATNDPQSDKCRRCGNKALRKKANEYRDE